MTFLEKLQMEHPEKIGKEYFGWCKGCPFTYGYEETCPSSCPDNINKEDCKKCWNREMPDTEPKVEVIQQAEIDAYGKGHADGVAQGMDDAWNFMKKWQNMTHEECMNIYDTCSTRVLLQKYTPQEAIAKMKEYEDAQNGLKVGDVIKLPFGNGVITSIDGENVVFMTKSGEFGRLEGSVPKTGKKLDVVGLLEQIGEQ